MKTTFYSLALAAVACGLAAAQTTAFTTPVGYVSQTCRLNSDTIVGVPLRQPTVAAAALTSNPTIGATNAVLTVTGATFGAYGSTHYVKFTSGPDSGSVFAITANDATTITIDRNGQSLAAVSGNTFAVTKFWTLNELFPPALCTNSAAGLVGPPAVAPTGTAIVSSLTPLAGARRTQLLLSDITTANVNLSASAIYYVLAPQVGPPATVAQWRQSGGSVDVGGLQLWPDTYFTIRNPSTINGNTTYTVTGEVDMSIDNKIPLYTRVGGSTAKRDNPRAITRPIDVTLNGLNLGGTPAFVTSATALAGARRDELLVFDNSVTSQNKSASAIYYYIAAQVGPPATPAQWRQAGGSTDAGGVVIPAGSGFIIRKFGTVDGSTTFWNNTKTY
jgi:uncharacterized protein (TIGR02597 family)